MIVNRRVFLLQIHSYLLFFINSLFIHISIAARSWRVVNGDAIVLTGTTSTSTRPVHHHRHHHPPVFSYNHQPPYSTQANSFSLQLEDFLVLLLFFLSFAFCSALPASSATCQRIRSSCYHLPDDCYDCFRLRYSSHPTTSLRWNLSQGFTWQLTHLPLLLGDCLP
jgi:hypothetical protein